MNLRDQLQQCLYELSEDSRAIRAGLSSEPHSEAILKKYPELADLETVAKAKAAYEAEADPAAKELLKRQYFFALSFYQEHKIAATQDKKDAFYAAQKVEVDGEEVAFFNLPVQIQREADPAKREAINADRLKIVKEGTTFSQEMLKETLDSLTKELGYTGYIPYCQDKKDMNYAEFKEVLEKLYGEVKELYWEHMNRWTEEGLNMRLGEVKKVHASVLVNLSRFDDLIKDMSFKDKVYDIFASMGLPFSDFPTINVDLEDRPSKNPRACCYSTRVPEEIHLLVKPTGKLTDYETFLHETGHAMHYGGTDASLPVELKEFGLSYALSETYAFLFEKLMFNEEFLKDQFGFDETTAKEVVYYHTLTNLWFLVRYIAKFMYEYNFFSQVETPEDGSMYASTLTEYTGFLYDDVSFLEDMDGEFYSADYLRAWIAERQLNHYLETHYGKRWYASKDASMFLKELWSLGDSMGCEQMISEKLSMNPFDTSFLVQSYKDPLTS